MIFIRSVLYKRSSVSNIVIVLRLLLLFLCTYVGKNLLVIDSCSVLCLDLNRFGSLCLWSGSSIMIPPLQIIVLNIDPSSCYKMKSRR